MTWQLGSFAVLGLVLVAGFTWYERSHPTSEVLALVATLAALAALGRVAFAPLPNVKPTTDIVLLSGYVLGGAPGFAVGAVAALASNLFFGQGPWTPWQMGAWGLVGVLGAALGAVSGRSLRRVPLALWCCAAGLLYGAVLDLSTWVTYTGEEKTLGTYLAVSGSSLAFNVAHAVGNVVFCLAFGPAFVRALLRFRARFAVSWESVPVGSRAAGTAVAALLALTVAGGAVGTPGAARAAAPASSAAAREGSVAYLLRAQNADGGFGPAAGTASSSLHSAWASMGLAAAGRAPAAVSRGGGRSLAAYLDGAARGAKQLGDVERTILALTAAGRDPRHAGGRDLLGALLARRRTDGSFGGQVNLTAFAVFCLRAAGRPAGDRSVRTAGAWIARQQNPDAGFSFARRGGPSGIDDTAAALQGLVAAGRGRGAGVARAAGFLVREQNRDGGFPLSPGGGSNAQSTAWAVQGLVAAGRDPERVRRGGSRSPLGYLRTLVTADGSVRYSRTSAQTPVWVTAQALTALARQPFPIPAVRGRGGAAGAGAGSRSAPVARPSVRAAPAAGSSASDRRAHGLRQARSPRSHAGRRGRSASTRRLRDAALDARLGPMARSAGIVTGLLIG
jgi:energy-coupling factor transport system substrate-specific component